MEKRQELYHGKAKTVYTTDDPKLLVMHYRDDVSAFDGAKLAKLERKGETNNKFNAFIMGKLAAAGVPTHFVQRLSDREMLTKQVAIVPIEVVVRKTAMARCDRCWTHRVDVRPAADGANLCGRCVMGLEAAARRAGIGAG